MFFLAKLFLFFVILVLFFWLFFVLIDLPVNGLVSIIHIMIFFCIWILNKLFESHCLYQGRLFQRFIKANNCNKGLAHVLKIRVFIWGLV